MHKLIIGSSTTLQISATLHKLHPTGHMLRAHIFDVGETNGSSYQQSVDSLSQCQNVVFQLCIMRVYCLYTRVLRESKHAAYTGG